MKRNFSNVTQDHIERLKKWLVQEDKNYCPFRGNGRTCESDICLEVFPYLTFGICPCGESSLKYVTRVARLIIHKWKYDW